MVNLLAGELTTNAREVLLPTINIVLKENPSVAKAYKEGKEASLQFLLGQSIKSTKGTVDPVILEALLIEQISLIP